jgi:hypothetical protein
MNPRHAATLAFVALTHCGSTAVTVPDAGADLGADAPARVDRPDVSAVADVPADNGACAIECPAPPMGCRYVGPVDCATGRCGAIACDDAGAAVMCSGTSPAMFPTFDRSCGGDGDCFAALHQTDCCGNSRALGLNVSARAAFAAAEMTCRAQYPGCGCPARAPTDDDGRSSVSGQFDARCMAGACRTAAR